MEIRVEITKMFHSDNPTKAFADVYIDDSDADKKVDRHKRREEVARYRASHFFFGP